MDEPLHEPAEPTLSETELALGCLVSDRAKGGIDAAGSILTALTAARGGERCGGMSKS